MRARTVAIGLALITGLVACGMPGTPPVDSPSPTPTQAHSPAPSPTTQSPEPVVLIIDGSGTMTITDIAPSRMDAAKQAAVSLLNSLPDQTPVAVITYGTNTGNEDADKPVSCQDITVPVDLTEMSDASRAQASEQINQLTPSGYTPIAGSLQRAAELLPDGRGTVILLSDGEDTCAPPDPCETAKTLAAAHPDLTISTVGLGTSTETNPQLSCIANAGGGLFVTASDTDALIRRLLAARDGLDARSSLSTTGLAGAQLGASHGEVVAAEPDFPAWSAATSYSTTLPGVDGVLVEIVWLDCSYVFEQESQTLVAIIPPGAPTVDGITVGDTATSVQSIYGEPVEVDQVADGWTARYWADRQAGTSFSITYPEDPRTTQVTKIIRIYLCRCLPMRSNTPDATVETLASAEMPEHCMMPRQRLVDGKTIVHELGQQGSINLDGQNDRPTPVFVDMLQAGYVQGFSVFVCSAGGSPWDNAVVLNDSDGALLAWYALSDYDGNSKGYVKSLTPQGNGVWMEWRSYAGPAYSDPADYRHFVTYQGGQLVFS